MMTLTLSKENLGTMERKNALYSSMSGPVNSFQTGKNPILLDHRSFENNKFGAQ
jgi:hypothetical protein